jgi:DNA repair exonuclease SbcCD ATPase subunit
MIDTKELDELINIENWSSEYYPMHYANHYVCNLPFPEPDIASAQLEALKAELAKHKIPGSWQKDFNLQEEELATLRSQLADLETSRNGWLHSTKLAYDLIGKQHDKLADKERELDEARKVIDNVTEEIQSFLFLPDDEELSVGYNPLMWCMDELNDWLSAHPKDGEK